MSWDRVRAWRDLLAERGSVDSGEALGLSPAGARAAWRVALEALSDNVLADVAAMAGEPFATAGFVAAATVFTAPIEWCAVLLGRGTAVSLRASSRSPGRAHWLAEAAAEVGLPLSLSDEVPDAELLVVMGSDATVHTLRPRARERFLGFGHRVSWAITDTAFAAVARDAALYDSRGCMSPVALITPLPLAEACEAMGRAMETQAREIPRGRLSPGEAAAIRSRRALARATGVVVEGEHWSVHGLPGEHVSEQGLPRSLVVVSTDDPQGFLEARATPISVVGTDQTLRLPADVRQVLPGAMQRPPVRRLHDGVDWLRDTLR